MPGIDHIADFRAGSLYCGGLGRDRNHLAHCGHLQPYVVSGSLAHGEDNTGLGIFCEASVGHRHFVFPGGEARHNIEACIVGGRCIALVGINFTEIDGGFHYGAATFIE